MFAVNFLYCSLSGLTHLLFNLLILYVFVFAVVKNIETSCQEKQYVTFLDASALFVAP